MLSTRPKVKATLWMLSGLAMLVITLLLGYSEVQFMVQRRTTTAEVDHSLDQNTGADKYNGTTTMHIGLYRFSVSGTEYHGVCNCDGSGAEIAVEYLAGDPSNNRVKRNIPTGIIIPAFFTLTAVFVLMVGIRALRANAATAPVG